MEGLKTHSACKHEDEATVIKGYNIMRGTGSVFTDISVEELPLLEKYVCPPPWQT